MSERVRVAVLAPASAIRAGLRTLLQIDPTIEIVAESGDLSEAGWTGIDYDLLLVTAEVIIADALSRMPGFFEGRAGLLIMADATDRLPGLDGLWGRPFGLISYDASGEELVAAVRAVALGLVVGDPDLVRLLPQATDEADGPSLYAESLTDRESEVLQLVAQGMANKQIAHTLSISEHTVKFHLSAIYSKLGATNRAEAVSIGVRRGLVML